MSEDGSFDVKSVPRWFGRGFIISDPSNVDTTVATAKADAVRCLPPGTRFEIRRSADRGALAWLRSSEWDTKEPWEDGRLGLDVISGCVVLYRGTTPQGMEWWGPLG